MIGKRFLYLDREVVITGFYEGHGPDDAPGYYYRFSDETVTHWVSITGVAVRFQPLLVWPANDREWARVNQPLTID